MFAAGVEIGFQEASHIVGESAPSVSICVELTDGEAAIPVEVTLMTGPPGNAQGSCQ